ncbi:MAG: polysaccharide biosynthesis/export family protein [Sulfurifustis sp.]
MPNPFSGGIFAPSPSTVPVPPLPAPDNAVPSSSVKAPATTNATSATAAPDVSGPLPPAASTRMFGAQLFNGSFRNLVGGGFNPNYQINIGDRIQLRMWGSFNFEGVMQVDAQGNIFLPNVGPVTVAGTRNAELNALVESQVRRVFKSNVSVYASLDVSQPVKVFVTGFVRQPGLYGGLASESVLNYLDRAGGVDPDRGSYVDVAIKRGSTVLKRLNLYEFLLLGKVDYLQLQDGDAIVVGPRKHTYSVFGEVYNAYDFEFEQPEIPLDTALAVAGPKPGATHVSVVRKQGSTKRSEYYPLKDAKSVRLQDGDAITVTSDRYAGTIQVRIEGAHSGEHALVLPYGSTMKDVIAQIKPNSMSRVDAIQLYRVSVAQRQKEMLNLSLNKLEEAAYSARSKTSEEANLRAREAELISKFVARARNNQPKGQVVLDQKTIASTLVEDGDVVTVPERTSVVMVHGEVLFPNAVSWRKGHSAEDYIKQVGGYTQNANTSKVIVIRPNGEALPANEAGDIAAGDEIIVLPKIDSKNIEVTRGITQILFQIAVTAKVVFGL